MPVDSSVRHVIEEKVPGFGDGMRLAVSLHKSQMYFSILVKVEFILTIGQ